LLPKTPKPLECSILLFVNIQRRLITLKMNSFNKDHP